MFDYLIIILVIVFVRIIGYMYFSKNQSITEQKTILADSDSEVKIEPVQDIKLDAKSDVKANVESKVDIPSEPLKEIIVEFKNNKYDITKFAKRHPGGKEVLLANNGKDVEKLMLENDHSINAYNLLERYRIKN